MPNFLLIANSSAGSACADDLALAVAVLEEAGQVEVCATSTAVELENALHDRGDRIVIVAGGDGSLHAVVAALHRQGELAGTTLGLLPLGTGNDFARGTSIPLDAEKAARLIVEGEAREVDLILDDAGGVVVNSIHVGVGAEASRQAHIFKKLLGKVGYLVGAVVASVKPPFLRLRVEVDGTVVSDMDRPVLQLAIGNGPAVGGGTELVPRADPESGKVDIMIAFAVGPLARFGYALHLRRGEHHERDDVLYLRGSTVTVAGQGYWCSADGEVFGPERTRTWRVEPGAYLMMLPD